jgi:hypothetical protein
VGCCLLCKSRIDGWSKTGRDGEGETFSVCDPCWEADRSGLVIVPGPVTVTARCDECLELMNPRELVVRRALEGVMNFSPYAIVSSHG